MLTVQRKKQSVAVAVVGAFIVVIAIVIFGITWRMPPAYLVIFLYHSFCSYGNCCCCYCCCFCCYFCCYCCCCFLQYIFLCVCFWCCCCRCWCWCLYFRFVFSKKTDSLVVFGQHMCIKVHIFGIR